jgi:transposase-like protein
MQAAYKKDMYDKAKAAFQLIRKELQLINESAVRSLDEGFEETLTVQRLSVHSALKKSFTTTNMLESINAQVEQKTERIDYCKNSSQKQRL